MLASGARIVFILSKLEGRNLILKNVLIKSPWYRSVDIPELISRFYARPTEAVTAMDALNYV